MTKYKDIDGDSGVDSFETGADYIDVIFSSSARTYRYNHAVTGVRHVETMKELASNGNDLNSYINRNVKYRYADKR